ncbi:MAG: AAA family ATPase [Sphingomonadales bacterium]|nr:AAA family ATPase [Sphingomonadales bacterium]MDE2569789.1 AAA family ATPase [Sphingomonadales bacterium]
MLTAEDPFCCIDMDVKDGTPAEHVERFDSIAQNLGSYTERSQSGRGVHVWVRAGIGRGRRRDGVEVYSQERFIICTGDVIQDLPIAPRQEVMANMAAQMGPPAVEIALMGDDCPDFTAAERAASDEGELGRLFAGDWLGRYPSQSEADLALVKLLVPLTDSPMECWRTFRLSKLGQREKAGRPDYARSTLGTALAHLITDAEQLRHGALVASAIQWSGTAYDARHLRLLLDGDLDALPRLRWLVKGVVPDAGIGAIYGESGTYKSFVTLDLLAHISNGLEWFGHRVSAAPAVYVPFEGQGGIPNRIRAWRVAQTAARHPGSLAIFEPDPGVSSGVAVVMEPLNLREQADRERLVTTLTECGWAGGVLCIDTLAHASNGIEENSSAMGEMIGIFRDLQHQLGGVILLVHHSGKDQSRGMRGWSGLHAAMDFVVECQREGDLGSREANFRLSKVKDGETGAVHKFRMEQVQLGFDEDGDPVTSLTVCDRCGDEGAEHPFKVDDVHNAADDEADDDFIWNWVKREVAEGEYPSGRSLEGQRSNQMSQVRRLTQARLRDAIHRLRAASRLVDAENKAPSGNVYMIAV